MLGNRTIHRVSSIPRLDPRQNNIASLKIRNLPTKMTVRVDLSDAIKDDNHSNKLKLTDMIDNWPAQSLGRSFASSEIVVRDGRLKILTEPETKLPNLVKKPRLLSELELQLSKKLKQRGLESSLPCIERLNIFRDILDVIIKSFKFHAPLLISIKREYDTVLKQQINLSKEFYPTMERAWTFANECVDQTELQSNKYPTAISTIKAQIEGTKDRIISIQNNDVSKKIDKEKIAEKLGKSSSTVMWLSDRNKLFTNALNSALLNFDNLQMATKLIFENTFEDSIPLKLAMQRVQAAELKITKKIDKFEEGLNDVVPRRLLHLERNRFNKMKKECDSLKMKFKSFETIMIDTEIALNKARKERDELKNMFNKAVDDYTPRPHFNDAIPLVGGRKHWKQLSHKKSSREKLTVLIHEMSMNNYKYGRESTRSSLLVDIVRRFSNLTEDTSQKT